MAPAAIVVVGGGYIGIQFAQDLAKQLNPSQASITLIEKNDFTFHCVGVPRALVDPTYVKKLFINIAHALPPTATVLRGIVDEIDGINNAVVVRPIVNDRAQETTTRVQFDYLVLATGSSYVSPIKVPLHEYTRANVVSAIHATAERIKAASSVLIVGGGPVGIEVAGEIASASPTKRVTILEGQNSLVHNAKLKDEFRAQLTEKLMRLNVHLVLGERLQLRSSDCMPHATTFTTNKGTKIEADMHLLCAGMSPNVDLIRKLDASLLSTTSKGVRVNGACQVDDPRYSHVFVVGDASDHPTPKLAYVGGFQAAHVATELAKWVAAGSGNSIKLTPYVPPSTEGMLIPLGKNVGVGQVPLFGGVVVGNAVIRFIKGHDYFATTFCSKWRTTEDGDPILVHGWVRYAMAAAAVVAGTLAAWHFSKSS
ncbi:hypothetical protein H310_06116 [Aphanomyces invadans]|uniref:FAD/NAD(P)-binding domain-containing protein n=1 Tax=Aphanomyces invadans TaxID=157072 RepID=A0A024U9T8_9STRA|nr:hypothetical protein H310_06116 [Aphanomyces invadans]ETW02657.1 hypothetical protein H310_06116 [Aphanomyces invadans]|eukprot:XP_008869262.1 hypothetical protein H310_06116 [Aphanomyces invadans]